MKNLSAFVKNLEIICSQDYAVGSIVYFHSNIRRCKKEALPKNISYPILEVNSLFECKFKQVMIYLPINSSK